MLGSCGASGRTDANVGAVVAGNSYRRPSFMARWGLSAYSHFTFARSHPEGTLRESCMRENRTCSLSGGRRPAWPQGLRASSDPTKGSRTMGVPVPRRRQSGPNSRFLSQPESGRERRQIVSAQRDEEHSHAHEDHVGRLCGLALQPPPAPSIPPTLPSRIPNTTGVYAPGQTGSFGVDGSNGFLSPVAV